MTKNQAESTAYKHGYISIKPRCSFVIDYCEEVPLAEAVLTAAEWRQCVKAGKMDARNA